jgi:hypothetical protein
MKCKYEREYKSVREFLVELVDVQPMKMPSGNIFHYQFHYGSTVSSSLTPSEVDNGRETS